MGSGASGVFRQPASGYRCRQQSERLPVWLAGSGRRAWVWRQLGSAERAIRAWHRDSRGRRSPSCPMRCRPVAPTLPITNPKQTGTRSLSQSPTLCSACRSNAEKTERGSWLSWKEPNLARRNQYATRLALDRWWCCGACRAHDCGLRAESASCRSHDTCSGSGRTRKAGLPRCACHTDTRGAQTGQSGEEGDRQPAPRRGDQATPDRDRTGEATEGRRCHPHGGTRAGVSIGRHDTRVHIGVGSGIIASLDRRAAKAGPLP